MQLPDLERALARLEAALSAYAAPEALRREIDTFATHIAAELSEALEERDRLRKARGFGESWN